MAKVTLLICPYCGQTQPQVERCRSCGGLLEPLSRQATHNAMGPWFVRDPDRPHQPGCSYETLVKLVEREQIAKHTIIRGPTTRQFWTIAKRVPGVAHLLGYCHNCAASVDPADHGCHACGVPFGAYLDRNYLGLPEIRPLPWEAQLEGNEPPRFAGRSVQGSHAGHAAGLSSFASDEELLGEVGSSGSRARGPAGAAAPAGAQGPVRSAPSKPANEPGVGSVAQAQTPQVGANLFDDYAAAAVTRSLQRKVAAQRRTIRGLGQPLSSWFWSQPSSDWRRLSTTPVRRPLVMGRNAQATSEARQPIKPTMRRRFPRTRQRRTQGGVAMMPPPRRFKQTRNRTPIRRGRSRKTTTPRRCN